MNIKQTSNKISFYIANKNSYFFGLLGIVGATNSLNAAFIYMLGLRESRKYRLTRKVTRLINSKIGCFK